MTSIGKTPVIVRVANRPDIMFLVMGFHLLLTSGSFSLWSAGEEPFFITFATSKSNMAGQERHAGVGEPALSC